MSREDKIDITDSESSRLYSFRGFTYSIDIYTSQFDDGWILEIISPDNDVIIWDDTFEDDEEALKVAINAIQTDDELKPNKIEIGPLDKPLDETELLDLDMFICTDYDAEKLLNQDGQRARVASISELDGFLTAIISAPVQLTAEEWQPVLWRDEEPDWDIFGKEATERLHGFLFRLLYSNLSLLSDDPESFQPIFASPGAVGVEELTITDWCRGYIRALLIKEEDWIANGEPVKEELRMIGLFGTIDGIKTLLEMPRDEIQEFEAGIPDAIRKIFVQFKQDDTADQQTVQPFERGLSKVGRNDPCPCGSGKKFKKCCLH